MKHHNGLNRAITSLIGAVLP